MLADNVRKLGSWLALPLVKSVYHPCDCSKLSLSSVFVSPNLKGTHSELFKELIAASVGLFCDIRLDPSSITAILCISLKHGALEIDSERPSS